jgi:WD40 repeat protein
LQISEGTAKLAMSIDANGKFYRWDYSQQKILGKITLDTGHILKSAISPDGSLIVTGYDNGMLGTWNSQSGKKLAEYSEHTAQITSLVFSGDGKYLASSDSTGHVILWNVMADHQLRTSANFTDPNGSAIQTLLFSRDGKQVFGAGCGYPIPFPSPDCGQGLIHVWNDRLENQFTLPGMSGFALSLALNPVNPDELAVGTRDGTITIWNLSSKKTRLSLKLGKSDITALAFQPTDGTLLAVAADGYKVYLYNTVSGQKMGQSFRDHDGPVTALVFSVDGKTLLSASTDNTIVIHDMNPEGWQEHACRAANHNFSRDQWQTYIGNAVPYGAICPEFPIEIETTPTP